MNVSQHLALKPMSTVCPRNDNRRYCLPERPSNVLMYQYHRSSGGGGGSGSSLASKQSDLVADRCRFTASQGYIMAFRLQTFGLDTAVTKPCNTQLAGCACSAPIRRSS